MDRIVYYTQTNIACIVILCIIFVSYLKFSNKSLRGKLFIGIIISTMALCLSDAIAGVFRGSDYTLSRFIIWTSNIVYTVSMLSIGYFWLLFSNIVLTDKLEKKSIIGVGCLVGLFALLTITTPLHKLIFSIDSDNLYKRGSLLWVNYISIFICYTLGFIHLKNSNASKIEKIAIISFPVAPIIATILQFLFYGITVGQVGTTIAVLLVFTLLQGIDFNEQKLKIRIYNELSRVDNLTNLQNRKAYNERLEKVKNVNWVGVVFMDLNGLKEVNDNEGHKKGDEYIKSFSETLREVYNYDDIYRISGDEFVALIEDENVFRSNINTFGNLNNDVSSFGYCESSGKDIDDTIRKAELNMYKYKSDYYIRTGKNRRSI